MNMNHMTATGIKGLDLYCLQDGKWVFAGSGRPQGKVNQATIVKDMLPEEREYLLYLSLYDGVVSLSIGVDSLSLIGGPAVDLPVRKKPLVFYGTSILQGGCASRPGMAHTNILERRLNRECINLGFSGNALLDLEIARVMAEVDASVFVNDNFIFVFFTLFSLLNFFVFNHISLFNFVFILYGTLLNARVNL